MVSKDASKVLLQDLNFINNNIDFSSFVKKSYFGPSETIFQNTYVNKYLIENNSKIIGKDSILFTRMLNQNYMVICMEEHHNKNIDTRGSILLSIIIYLNFYQMFTL